MFWKKEVPQAEFNFEAMHPISIERRDKLTIITAKDKAASKEEFEVEVTCSISVHNYLVSRFRQACMINQETTISGNPIIVDLNAMFKGESK